MTEVVARVVGVLAALLALALPLGAGKAERAAAQRAAPAVYWGAWIDGDPYRQPGLRRWRDAPWDRRSWNRFEHDAGRRVSLVHFGQPAPWAQPFSPLPLRLARRRGALPLMDMDTIDPARRSGRTATLAQIAAGAWDRPLRRWARAAARYRWPFFLRLNWEMNGSWFRWGREAAASPAAYVAAWRRFHRIAAAAGATNVTWVWCPNVNSPRTTPLAKLYPGARYVDWTCMDGYNSGPRLLQATGWKSFAELFAGTYRELLALAPRKPIMIAETASTETHPTDPSGRAKARWITDAFGTQLPRRFPRVKAVAWFNWDVDEGHGRWDWPIESSPAARRAFAAAIASPYYAGPRAVAPRRLRPIAPLP